MEKLVMVGVAFAGGMVAAYSQYGMFGVYCVVFIVIVHFALFHHEI